MRCFEALVQCVVLVLFKKLMADVVIVGSYAIVSQCSKECYIAVSQTKPRAPIM